MIFARPRFRVALLCAGALLAASAAFAAVPNPDKLVVLSMTDTRARLTPCGCHVPKGGLAREAFLVDSVRALYGRTLLVDNGGFFPAMDHWEEDAAFIMGKMHALGFRAVGVAGNDLRYGLPFLRENARTTGLPLTCANLVERSTGKPVFEPSLLLDVNGVKVGVFALITDQEDLGPSGGLLRVLPSEAVAAKTVKALRAKGAIAIVLLSQLGTIASEDLATSVPGIDAIVVGRKSPLLETGKRIMDTALSYAGESGYYVGYTVLDRDDRGVFHTGENRLVMLGPEVRDDPAMLASVTTYETRIAEKRRLAEKK